MMKLTAKHGVIYAGTFHAAGEVFEIDPAHAEEMAEYGTVTEEQTEAKVSEEQTSGRKRK